MKKILAVAVWWGLCPYNWGPLPPFSGDALHQVCRKLSNEDVDVDISTEAYHGFDGGRHSVDEARTGKGQSYRTNFSMLPTESPLL